MNAPLKISGYVAGLGLVFGAAVGVGAVSGPIGDKTPGVTDVSPTTGPDHGDMQPGGVQPTDDHTDD